MKEAGFQKMHRVKWPKRCRAIWRYIEAEHLNMDVVPALVYPCEPQAPGRKAEVETILDELGIQVVWRGLDIDSL
jgi:hypothetical protein